MNLTNYFASEPAALIMLLMLIFAIVIVCVARGIMNDELDDE